VNDLEASVNVTENPGAVAPRATVVEVKIVNTGALCHLGGIPTARWVQSGAAEAGTVGAASEPARSGADMVAAQATTAILHPGDVRYVQITIRPSASFAQCRPTDADELSLQFPADHGLTAKLAVNASGVEQKACANTSVRQLSTSGLLQTSFKHYAPPLQTDEPTNPVIDGHLPAPCDWSRFASKLTVGGAVGGVTMVEVQFTNTGGQACSTGVIPPTVYWVDGTGQPRRVGNASTSAVDHVADSTTVAFAPGATRYARVDIDERGPLASGDCTGRAPGLLEFRFDGAAETTYVDASLVTSSCAASPNVHLLTYYLSDVSTLQKDLLERESAEAAKQAAAEAAHHAATTAPTGH
jgi:hypothetical protein